MARQQIVAIAEDGALINRLLAAFEQAKRTGENGCEYWLAREYAEILAYTWEGFAGPMERGKAALAEGGEDIDDHFRHVSKVIPVAKGGEWNIGDIELTRRACYLVGINGDPRKKASIAAVQRYFAEQTRKQEINEMLGLAGADADRVAACRKLRETKDDLAEATKKRLTDPDKQLDKIKRRGQEALFAKSVTNIREDLDIPDDREIEDFVDPVIVKGTDFATSLTAKQVREDSALRGVGKIGDANVKNHVGLRRVMTRVIQFTA